MFRRFCSLILFLDVFMQNELELILDELFDICLRNCLSCTRGREIREIGEL